MKLLAQYLQDNGIATEGLVIHGRQAMEFSHTKEHDIGGHLVDVYVPRMRALVLRHGDEAVLDIPSGEPMFAELAETLDDILRLPLYEMLEKAGAPPNARTADFSIPYAKAAVLAKADDDAIDAALEQDEDRQRALFDEISWTRFQQSDAFAQAPCPRELFTGLNAEFKESKYWPSMEFRDYYRWFLRSSTLLDAGGDLTPETLAKANGHLDAWNDPDVKRTAYWLCKGMDVHPRHRGAFVALVEARANADAAPSAPTI